MKAAGGADPPPHSLPSLHPSPLHSALQRLEERPDGSSSKVVEARCLRYASWADATSCSLAGANPKRLSKLYLVLRGEPVGGRLLEGLAR